MSDLSREYPPNSRGDNNRKDQPKVTKPEVGKVISGDVTIKKASVGSKIKNSLVSETNKSVMEYVIFDIVIPNTKALLLDIVTQGLDKKLYGDSAPSRQSIFGYRGSKQSSYTPYNRMYKSPTSSPVRGSSKTAITKPDAEDLSIDTIIFGDRGQAEKTIYELNKIVEKYGEATVAELYRLVGITGPFTSEKYGWLDLRGAEVRYARGGGYRLHLPPEVELGG